MNGLLCAMTTVLLLAAPPKEQDFDKDGVPDLSDDCPTDPGNPTNKGCPGGAPPPPPPPPPEEPTRTKVTDGRIEITEQVLFRSGSASVDPRSFTLLSEIAATIKKLPPEKAVVIKGYTDNRGRRKMNIQLSKRRAQAVIAHLVRASVGRERLSAEGFGPKDPIASNKTKKGRAKNRRVEFHIVDAGAPN